ncbi:hypothetical protein [Arenivirga flava]|uniref:Uncharacterized protein n=1 Tax=Arenivirga flava TaxID=1930060 RepID=A0AA37UFQ6_9MICO|nr:hypothetical protein [Arenivirga flava]GMA29499.1 hypothetical protein GCM10025874_27520 [Arenivirga flava]
MSTPDPSPAPDQDRVPETGIDNGQDLSTRSGSSPLPILLGGLGVVVAIVLSLIGLSLSR